MKPNPIPALFLAQPGAALVGKGKPFKDHWELCRAAFKFGARGVTIPAAEPYIDLQRAARDDGSYLSELKNLYEDCGTPLLRLETHVSAQAAGGLHSSRVERFRNFFSPEKPFEDLRARARQFEQIGYKQMELAIRATGNLCLDTLVGWSGGRGWAAALYPWTPFPANYQRTILAFQVYRWQKLYELAHTLGIKAFANELHPESDIHSPRLLKMLRDMMEKVSPDAAKVIKANADASHPTLIGDDAADHTRYLRENGLIGAVHLKDGKLLRCPGGSLYGDFSPRWSDSRRRFQTFGTGDANWDDILPHYHEVHQSSEFDLPFVAELECSWLPNMMQGMEVALENTCRASRGEDLMETALISPIPGDSDWETFIWTEATADGLLELDDEESRAVLKILEMIQ